MASGRARTWARVLLPSVKIDNTNPYAFAAASRASFALLRNSCNTASRAGVLRVGGRSRNVLRDGGRVPVTSASRFWGSRRGPSSILAPAVRGLT